MTDVSWMYKKKGKITINLETDVDQDRILEDVLEAGGDDFTFEEEDKQRILEVTCDFEKLGKVGKDLQNTGRYVLQSLAPHYSFEAKWQQPEDKDPKVVEEEISTFLDKLEDLEEVVRLHTNLP